MRYQSLVVVLIAGLVLAAPVPASAVELQESIHAFLSNLPPDFETVASKTLLAKQNAGENVFVLDVREPDEFKAGHIEGAVNLPIRSLAQNGSALPADKTAQIAVVCKSGIRAAYATMSLKLLGYKNVKDVAGGMMGWEKDGLPLTK
jgi:rhodanese-related sulfurtransferase